MDTLREASEKVRGGKEMTIVLHDSLARHGTTLARCYQRSLENAACLQSSARTTSEYGDSETFLLLRHDTYNCMNATQTKTMGLFTLISSNSVTISSFFS